MHRSLKIVLEQMAIAFQQPPQRPLKTRHEAATSRSMPVWYGPSRYWSEGPLTSVRNGGRKNRSGTSSSRWVSSRWSDSAAGRGQQIPSSPNPTTALSMPATGNRRSSSSPTEGYRRTFSYREGWPWKFAG